MKALAVFPGEKAIRLVDCPEPKVARPSEVKLRMLEVGICSTPSEASHEARGREGGR